jgi:hypothetical protein
MEHPTTQHPITNKTMMGVHPSKQASQLNNILYIMER